MVTRYRQRWVGAGALAAVLVLTACGSDDEPAAAPGSVPATTATTTAPSAPVASASSAPAFEAEDVDDFGKLCTAGDHRSSTSERYVGDAPHAIVVFAREVGSKGYERRYIPRDKPLGYDPQKPADVALLVCVSGVKSGKTVGNCRYRTSGGAKTVRVDGQRFTLDVYALDTGRRVARRTFNADFCPPTLLTTDNGKDLPSRMTATMNDEDLFKVLDRYVSVTVA